MATKKKINNEIKKAVKLLTTEHIKAMVDALKLVNAENLGAFPHPCFIIEKTSETLVVKHGKTKGNC